MKTKKIISFMFVLFLAFGLANLNLAEAQNFNATIPPTDLPDAQGGIKGILINFMNWLLSIVGILGILAFALAGVMYLISAGDPNLADRAKSTMVYAILGILAALSGLIVIRTIDSLLRANNP
jgi:cytochrome bd-type quinol oxidase subunit 2